MEIHKTKYLHQVRTLQLLINQNISEEDVNDGYYADNKVVHLSSNTVDLSRLFSQQGVDYFTYSIGLALGAFDRSAGDVGITDNPIAPQGFQATSSYMNSKNISESWDEVSARLIREGSGFARTRTFGH